MTSLGRVLVIDDQPHVARLLRGALTDFGYTVKVALTAGEALGLITVFQPDVVLLDLWTSRLPDQAVLREFERRDPALPVIIVTANRDIDVARAGLEMAFDYVSTPLDLDVLQRIVAAAVIQRDNRPSFSR